MNERTENLTGRLGSRSALTDLYRLGSVISEPGNRKGNRVSTASDSLHDHAAITRHGDGVGSEALANFTECWASYGAGRIRGTGKLQYELGGTNEQRFEGLSGGQLCDELLDELSDASNYIAMLAIKVLALRNTLADV